MEKILPRQDHSLEAEGGKGGDFSDRMVRFRGDALELTLSFSAQSHRNTGNNSRLLDIDQNSFLKIIHHSTL